MGKQFFVKIIWGSESWREENPTPCEYSFDTEAELNAFMEGVDAASGYMDYEVVDDSETNQAATGD